MNNSLAKGLPRQPGSGQSKNARRRRRRRAAQQQPRKVAPAARALRRRRGQVLDSFVHCVLDPFTHSGPLTGVPDRFSGLSIVLENRTLKTFQDLKSHNVFLIVPSLGTNLIYRTSTTEIVAFKPVKQPDDWNAVAATISDDVPAFFSKFRTISLAVKIRYMGVAAVRNGWFRVGRFNWQTNLELYEAETGTGTDKATNRVVEFDTLDLQENAIMALPSSVTLTVEQGVYATSVRHGADSWEFTPILPYPAAITTDDCVKIDASKINYANATINSYDSDWAGIAVYLNVPTPSNNYFGKVAFEVEVRHCVEAIPALTSSNLITRTMARQSPKANAVALNAVSNVQRDLPAAIPHEESWIERFARGAGRVAGNLLTGFASPMISAVTSGLSALGLGGPSNTINTGRPALM